MDRVVGVTRRGRDWIEILSLLWYNILNQFKVALPRIRDLLRFSHLSTVVGGYRTGTGVSNLEK